MLCIRLIFQQQESILIAQRGNTEFAPYQWGLIGGKVQQNETALQAVVRKAHEELGITLDHANISLVHTMHRKSGDETIVILFFKITQWTGELCNNAPSKYEQVLWRNCNDLPHDVMPAHVQALQLIQQHCPYSKHGWSKDSTL